MATLDSFSLVSGLHTSSGGVKYHGFIAAQNTALTSIGTINGSSNQYYVNTDWYSAGSVRLWDLYFLDYYVDSLSLRLQGASSSPSNSGWADVTIIDSKYNRVDASYSTTNNPTYPRCGRWVWAGSFNPLFSGTYTVTVTDGVTANAPSAFTTNPSWATRNAAPGVVSLTTSPVANGTPAPTYSYSESSALVNVTPSGVVSWTSSNTSTSDRTAVITTTATNAGGSYSDNFTVTQQGGPGSTGLYSWPMASAGAGSYSPSGTVTFTGTVGAWSVSGTGVSIDQNGNLTWASNTGSSSRSASISRSVTRNGLTRALPVGTASQEGIVTPGAFVITADNDDLISEQTATIRATASGLDPSYEYFLTITNTTLGTTLKNNQKITGVTVLSGNVSTQYVTQSKIAGGTYEYSATLRGYTPEVIGPFGEPTPGELVSTSTSTESVTWTAIAPTEFTTSPTWASAQAGNGATSALTTAAVADGIPSPFVTYTTTSSAISSINSGSGLVTWTENTGTSARSANVTATASNATQGGDSYSESFAVYQLGGPSIDDFTYDIVDATSQTAANTVSGTYSSISYALVDGDGGTVDSSTGAISWEHNEESDTRSVDVMATAVRNGASVEKPFTAYQLGGAALSAFTYTTKNATEGSVNPSITKTGTAVFSYVSGSDAVSVDTDTGQITWSHNEEITERTATIKVVVSRNGDDDTLNTIVTQQGGASVSLSYSAVNADVTEQDVITDGTYTSISYEKVSGDSAGSVNSTTGLVTWTGANSTSSNRSILVRATVSRNGDTDTAENTATQLAGASITSYTYSTKNASAGTVGPVISAVGTLSYAKVSTSTAYSIHPTTGVITWLKNETDDDLSVTVRATASQNGTTDTEVAIAKQQGGVELAIGTKTWATKSASSGTVTPTGSISVTAGSSVSYSVSGTGASVNSTTGVLSWTFNDSTSSRTAVVTITASRNGDIDTVVKTVTQLGKVTPDTNVTFSTNTPAFTDTSYTLTVGSAGATTVYQVRSGSYGGSVLSTFTGNTTNRVINSQPSTLGTTYYVTGYVSTANNGDGVVSNVGTFTVTRTDNEGPVIGLFIASPSIIAGAGTVTLTVSGVSDADGTISSLAISNSSGTVQTLAALSTTGLGTNSASASTTFTLDGTLSGTSVFLAEATDDNGATISAYAFVDFTATGGGTTPPATESDYGVKVYGPNEELWLTTSDALPRYATVIDSYIGTNILTKTIPLPTFIGDRDITVIRLDPPDWRDTNPTKHFKTEKGGTASAPTLIVSRLSNTNSYNLAETFKYLVILDNGASAPSTG